MVHRGSHNHVGGIRNSRALVLAWEDVGLDRHLDAWLVTLEASAWEAVGLGLRLLHCSLPWSGKERKVLFRNDA